MTQGENESGSRRMIRLATRVGIPSAAAWSLAPAVLILLVAMAAPLAVIVLRSFSEPTLGLQNYIWFFSVDANITVLVRTFLISAAVAAVCLIFGYPYAYMMTAVRPNVKMLLMLCLLVPFWMSGTVRTLAWVVILQNNGVINSTLRWLGIAPLTLIRTQTGVIIGMAQVIMPFVILPLYSVMKGIDPRLEQAARSLGATPARAFATVYLSLSLPGVYAGGTLAFILSLGFYITPALLGGPGSVMLSTLVQTQVSTLLNWGRAGAMGAILLAFTFLALGAAAPFLRRRYK